MYATRNRYSAGPLLLALVVTVGCSSSAPPPVPSPSASGAVIPEILNREQVEEAIGAEYPPDLRAEGIGGVVTLLVRVGTDGIPLEVRLQEGSGYRQFDEAAARVAVFLRFSPARRPNGDIVPVPVWITFPITFSVRARRPAIRQRSL